jgi:guanine nucleotide-binding protein subunit alpha
MGTTSTCEEVASWINCSKRFVPRDTVDAESSSPCLVHFSSLWCHFTKQDEKRARKHIKLLLLGAGASGKSTVLKQMRLIHNVTFTDEEIECEFSGSVTSHERRWAGLLTCCCLRGVDYRQLVFDNIVQGMKLIIDAMDEWEISVESSNRVRPASSSSRMFLTIRIALQKFIALVDDAPEIQDGQVFPFEYREPLERLWRDRGVQHACQRGNEYALPENLP